MSDTKLPIAWLEFEIPFDRLKASKEFDPYTSKLRFKIQVSDYTPIVYGAIDDVLCDGMMIISTNEPVPYQKCPKCDGQGTVGKPPWIAGDQHTWSSTSTSFVCDVCNGAKIIPMYQNNKQ